MPRMWRAGRQPASSGLRRRVTSLTRWRSSRQRRRSLPSSGRRRRGARGRLRRRTSPPVGSPAGWANAAVRRLLRQPLVFALGRHGWAATASDLGAWASLSPASGVDRTRRRATGGAASHATHFERELVSPAQPHLTAGGRDDRFPGRCENRTPVEVHRRRRRLGQGPHGRTG